MSAYITLVFLIQEVRWISCCLVTMLSNIAYREGFLKLKRKYQALKLNFPLTWTCTLALPQPGKEDRIILVESFASRGRV